jgi:phage gp46-like protein
MTAYLNPLTADYLIDSGRVVADPANGVANAVYLRLMTPLGSWWADKTLGSRLHELAREKDLPRVAVLARQFVQMALQPVLDDGRANSITVDTQRAHDGRLQLRVEVEAAHGERMVFNQFVGVAG